jgi:inner membrane protein involved in colicin E2 resistance
LIKNRRERREGSEMATEPGMITLTTSNLLSMASIGLTVLLMIVGYFKFVLGFAEKLAEVKRECVERIAKLEGQFQIMWGPLVNVLVKEIKQPIHVEKDGLLDKLNGCSKEMTTEELQRLRVILEQEMEERSAEWHLKYALLLGRVDTLLFERGHK